MSWRYATDTKSIDNLVGYIFDELKNNGGWSEIDAGYKVLRNPDGDFEVFFDLEATNKRYIQIEIGENGAWDTGSHSMGTPKISFGIVLYDGASAAGASEGTVKLSYDDGYCVLVTDYKSAGANYRRCLAYIGLAHNYKAGDTCLIGGSTLFRGGTTIPTNDSTIALACIMMHDLSGVANKPSYQSYSVGSGSWTANAPRGRIHAAKQDYRLMFPVWLGSTSGYPSGGENAGIRARLETVYCGCYDDAETHGQTIIISGTTIEYSYFIQADVTSYSHFPTHLLFRVA